MQYTAASLASQGVRHDVIIMWCSGIFYLTLNASGTFFCTRHLLVHTSYSFVLKRRVGISVAWEAPGWLQSKSTLRTGKMYVRHSRPNTKENIYISVKLTIRVASLVTRNNVKCYFNLRPWSRKLVTLSPTYIHILCVHEGTECLLIFHILLSQGIGWQARSRRLCIKGSCYDIQQYSLHYN